MFGVTIAANEISKDARPEPNGVMVDNDGNIVGTTQEKGSVEHANNRVTTVPEGADSTALWELNTLSDSLLVTLTTVTVPLDSNRNKMYLVQSVESDRSTPSDIVITIRTTGGTIIVCRTGTATVTEPATTEGGTPTITTLTAPSPAASEGRRRRQ